MVPDTAWGPVSLLIGPCLSQGYRVEEVEGESWWFFANCKYFQKTSSLDRMPLGLPGSSSLGVSSDEKFFWKYLCTCSLLRREDEVKGQFYLVFATRQLLHTTCESQRIHWGFVLPVETAYCESDIERWRLTHATRVLLGCSFTKTLCNETDNSSLENLNRILEISGSLFYLSDCKSEVKM